MEEKVGLKTFGKTKEAYLALVEHLCDGIRWQATSVCPQPTLPDEMSKHRAIVLPFRRVDRPESLRR